MIFIKVSKPIYGFTFRNENYGVGEVGVQFYKSEKRRNKVMEHYKLSYEYDVEPFRFVLEDVLGEDSVP